MDWNWLTPPVIIQIVVAITILIAFYWKLATKDDIKSLKDEIKSLKAETERDVESLKTDTERDIDSLKTDIREIRQGSASHSAKTETPHEDLGPPSIEKFKTPRKGESTADEHDRRTRS